MNNDLVGTGEVYRLRECWGFPSTFVEVVGLDETPAPVGPMVSYVRHSTHSWRFQIETPKSVFLEVYRPATVADFAQEQTR